MRLARENCIIIKSNQHEIKCLKCYRQSASLSCSVSGFDAAMAVAAAVVRKEKNYIIYNVRLANY